MPTINFRTKPHVEEFAGRDGTCIYIRVPEIKRTHCDEASFRNSRDWQGILNSNLFLPAVNKAVKRLCGSGGVIFYPYPTWCTVVDTGGILVSVSLTIGSWR